MDFYWLTLTIIFPIKCSHFSLGIKAAWIRTAFTIQVGTDTWDIILIRSKILIDKIHAKFNTSKTLIPSFRAAVTDTLHITMKPIINNNFKSILFYWISFNLRVQQQWSQSNLKLILSRFREQYLYTFHDELN